MHIDKDEGDRKGLHPTPRRPRQLKNEGDRKGLHPTPRRPRPYKEDEVAARAASPSSL